MVEKILLAVDGSEHARKAVPATIELARAGQGTVHVHVLHVHELAYAPAAVVGDSREEAAQLVAGVVAELKQARGGDRRGLGPVSHCRAGWRHPRIGSRPRRRHDRARLSRAVAAQRTAARQCGAQGHPARHLPCAGDPRPPEPG
jgi:universal stress protein family protein